MRGVFRYTRTKLEGRRVKNVCMPILGNTTTAVDLCTVRCIPQGSNPDVRRYVPNQACRAVMKGIRGSSLRLKAITTVILAAMCGDDEPCCHDFCSCRWAPLQQEEQQRKITHSSCFSIAPAFRLTRRLFEQTLSLSSAWFLSLSSSNDARRLVE